MNIEQIREQFEDWADDEGYDLQRNDLTDYEVGATRIAWSAWRARGATFVVKLPHDVTHVTNKDFEAGRDAVVAAIEAAGGTVNP